MGFNSGFKGLRTCLVTRLKETISHHMCFPVKNFCFLHEKSPQIFKFSHWNTILLLFFLCGAATQRGSWPPHSWGFLDHTQRRTSVGRTPLDEWSARHRDLYLKTHNTHNRQTSMPPGGIRTHDLSRRAAADLRLRPRGHCDRPILLLNNNNSQELFCISL